MSPDEIATMLDALADKITEVARSCYGASTRPAISGDAAITVIALALREIAEQVSRC